jgi:DNA-binding CsgD family transcriptional regulator
MISTRDFSELLLLIRSTPGGFDSWTPFLDQLGHLTNARTAVVILRRPQSGINKLVAMGGTMSMGERQTIFPESQKAYAECYGSQDPYHAALMRSRLAGMIPGEVLIRRQLLERSDMYHALLAPNGLEHMCLASLTSSNDVYHQLAVWREGCPGPFSSDECDWLSLLIPHLQAAIAIQRSLGLKSKHLAYSSSMLESLNYPMFLLDCGLRLVHFNGVAEHLLQCGNTFRLKGKTLQIRDARGNRQFHDLLARILVRTPIQAADPGGVMLLPASHSESASTYVLVAPIFVRLAGDTSATHILVLVKETSHQAPISAQAMGQLWSCTTAEAEVAALLVADRSAEEIATLRGVRIGTVRNQIKSLLAKTGARRQSQLVRLLLGISPI